MKLGFDQLVRLARRIARRASRIYIGRSGNPKRRLLQHLARRRLPYLSILYWAYGEREADLVEMALIRELGLTSLKMQNGDEGGTGQFARQAEHAIYLAWAPKRGESLASVEGPRGHVDDPRCNPGRAVPFHLTADGPWTTDAWS